jgi:serralysin
MSDVPGSTSTGRTIAVGGSLTGSLETPGDHDWYKITLTAGQKIVISLGGSGATPVADTYLYLRDSVGNLISSDDDGGPGTDSRIVFTVTTTGTYYIDVGAWNEGYSGGYELSVQTYTPPPVFDWDEAAQQLTHGYWDGDWHRWDVSQGDSITVNLTALTQAGKALARAALAEWTDIIGVNFTEVSAGGQITFDDNEEGAFTSTNWANHVITSAHVNVSTQWLADYGTGLGTYSFQSYLHEIGHALGLGHAGNYNGDASYEGDAIFANDGWPTTIMSYFDQDESAYFNDRSFTREFVGTPMNADIVAMQALYGLSTTTRTGNTTYGFNSNANRDIFHADQYPDVAYTIIDSGGVDTLDYSGFPGGNLINLNSETFSDIGGRTGNVFIARGTVIENAIGGSGSTLIIGNGANNRLDGGPSRADTVSYETATAAVTVSLLVTTAQDTGGAGIDTLLNFEALIGSRFDDVLTGAGGADVHGGEGNDLITAAGGDFLYGDAGDDWIAAQSGQFSAIYGGDGWDTADLSSSPTKITVDLALQTPSDSGSRFYSIEQLIGSSFADKLTGTADAETIDGGNGADNLLGVAGADKLVGGAGNDTLDGGTGNDQLIGGSGNDLYYADSLGDVIVEGLGEGTDRVFASASHALSDNIEILTLTGTGDIYGYGNNLANTLTGNTGSNKLFGLGGNDILDGGTGIDRMAGGAGNDRYYVDAHSDSAVENAGEGADRVFSTANFRLSANVEKLTLTGAADLDGYGNELANTLTGNSGANKLYGLDGNDFISGGSRADKLYGGLGSDTLKGDAGGDWIEGGSGRDVLCGDLGTDTFVFRNGDFGGATKSTADRIVDFRHSEGDRIRLDYVDANSANGGGTNEKFSFIGSAAFSHTAGELRYEQVSGNTFVYGDTNGDGLADFMIRLDGSHALTSADFLL